MALMSAPREGGFQIWSRRRLCRADQLANSIDGSADLTEYLTIVAAIMGYQAKRWPSGKVEGGKGKQ